MKGVKEMKRATVIIVFLLLIGGILLGCQQPSRVIPSPTPQSLPTPSTEIQPTVDIIEFPTKAEIYTHATIGIKTDTPGAYSLTLVDEEAGGLGNANRLYTVGTVLTDDYGFGEWQFKVDKEFELDRVQIRYKGEQQSLLIIDTVMIFR